MAENRTGAVVGSRTRTSEVVAKPTVIVVGTVPPWYVAVLITDDTAASEMRPVVASLDASGDNVGLDSKPKIPELAETSRMETVDTKLHEADTVPSSGDREAILRVTGCNDPLAVKDAAGMDGPKTVLVRVAVIE